MTSGPPTDSSSRILRFLRDCYEADNREGALFDLRADKVQHLQFLPHGGELLAGALDVVPVDRVAALEAQKAADLQAAEKTLLFGAFLLTGRLKAGPRQPKTLFAPLLLYPARVEDAGTHACLRVDLREQRINSRTLTALLGENEASADYLEEIVARIPLAPFEPHRVQEIIAALQEFLPAVDVQDLFQFPRVPAAAVQAALERGPGETLQCHPAYAMALVPNSPDTRGVLSELAVIAGRPSRSAPLRALLGETRCPPVRPRPLPPHAPAVLSSAQAKAVHSALVHPLTLLIGPPGTGKSYTVATLAVDQVLRGKSVLLASKTDQALDVLADKMAALVGDGGFLLRGSRAGHTRELKESLGQLLEAAPPASADGPVDAAGLRRLRRQLAAQSAALTRLESMLSQRAAWEIQWGDDTTEGAASQGLRRWLRGIRLQVTDWRLARQGHYWDLMRRYQEQLRGYHAGIARFFRASRDQRLRRTLDRHRQELVTLAKALRARTHHRQEAWFAQADWSLLLQTFPIWLTTLADAGDLLPLRAELFDLVILDEATQCDMASSLPVFHRGRRAVVTGDPRQLRHLSFLSRDRQGQLAAKWGLTEAQAELFDYRERSLLDLVGDALPSQEQVAFLDEHFRSRPAIIAFSNRQFYQGALKIMTERPDTRERPAVVIRPVDGRRDPGGPNRPEADQLVQEVRDWIASEHALAPPLAHSLGILSPFREQVDYLFARISQAAGLAAIRKHRLRIGTAHAFQGEERDVMFLSFAIDREAHPASLRYLDRADVFNVSVTRARNLQVVFCSVGPGELPGGSLLRSYLESVAVPPVAAGDPALADTFRDEVRAALLAEGCLTWPGYVVAGLPVDLLVEKEGRAVGLDLIGHPGRLVQAFDLEKYRMFHRAGLRLFPLSYSAWCGARSDCLRAVHDWLAAGPGAPPPAAGAHRMSA